MISTSFVLFVNHLLAKEPWARERLQLHANKLVCVDLELVQLRANIGADGLLQAADTNTTPANVSLRIKPADLPLIAQDPKKAVSYVKIDGDADLANVISGLSQDLRWEAEEDLAKLFGDITASRMVSSGNAVREHLQRTHQSLKENFAEYFLEENPMLVRPQAVEAFATQVVKTRDDVERLMKRIERLEKAKVQK
ncbi:sterol-binding protein [Undibacterium sp. LX40W]|uniref:Ubiquinone biosynthesis accessory factor UbiJ n=1 Tax=Undibacterium nitidum TaxID=2762298 RepID=A0A923HMB6_9BURK|nr:MULTISPECIES: sterol-binding protein [Undibacterium]MBC3880993.1 sterol-binding protein [Undibacterium nitidum]MBC3890274.1 sterol-binding protein [Undibacterium sp. LX40W]